MSRYTRAGRYALRKARLPEHLQHLLDEYAEFMRDVRGLWEEKIADKKACRPGCNHCCYLLSMISFSDALLAAQYLLSHKMTERIEDLQSMADLQKSFLKDYNRFEDDDAFVDAWLDEWIPCPLLDEEGRCSIYPVRPTACWHHAASDEEGCRRENVKTTETALGEPKIVEAMTKADWDLWLNVLVDRVPLPLPTSLGIVLGLGFILSGGDLDTLRDHLRPLDEEEQKAVLGGTR